MSDTSMDTTNTITQIPPSSARLNGTTGTTPPLPPTASITHTVIDESWRTDYDNFLSLHRVQLLDVLQIPEPLIESLYHQLRRTYRYLPPEEKNTTVVVVDNDDDDDDDEQTPPSSKIIDSSVISFRYDIHHATKAFQQQLTGHYPQLGAEYGTIMVLPHVVTWDMLFQGSFIKALLNTDLSVLQYIYDGLMSLSSSSRHYTDNNNSSSSSSSKSKSNNANRIIDLVNAIADHPMVWSRIVLYRSPSTSLPTTTTIYAALLAPPYLPHVPLNHRPTQTTTPDDDVDEADCTGPFTFQYHSREPQHGMIDVSLLYVSPDGVHKMNAAQNNYNGTNADIMPLPTIDLVPKYQYPNQQTLRIGRYVALELLPNIISGGIGTGMSNHPMMVHVKEVYSNFVHQMHMVRQQMLEQSNVLHQYTVDDGNEESKHHANNNTGTDEFTAGGSTVYRVYTDSNDPMGLHHPVVGLETNSQYFRMVTNIEDADIVYSYQSIFSPEYVHYPYIQRRNNSHCHPIRINQFPYEGAFVQKDHLARGVLQQHGLPRPSWSLETYDLDVHFTEFVGSVILSMDDAMKMEEQQLPSTIASKKSTTGSATATGIANPAEAAPLWIIKPASGTQSQGHIVTKNVAHIVRINDAAGGRRVAQRYIEHPVCIHHHKVDCRVIVLMTSAGSIDENGHIVQLPTLYMHDTCYFRIANKPHHVSTPIDRNDHESVLTASHLLHDNHRTSSDELQKLPQHTDTIQQLEREYPNAFDWNKKILPQIQTMIRELFNGMTKACPKMIEAKYSRAVYGVDVMFQIDDDDDDNDDDRNVVIVPKLTEVTFCPANNAICDAYVRNDDLYRTYNREIFECLVVGIVSKNISRLQ